MEVCAKKSAVASHLRPVWVVAFDAPWKLAALLLAMVAGGVLLLGAAGGGGPWMVAHFVFMAALPFVFLTHEGRKAIGLRLPSRLGWLLWGPLLGALAAIVIGLIGLLLFDCMSADIDDPRVAFVDSSFWHGSKARADAILATHPTIATTSRPLGG